MQVVFPPRYVKEIGTKRSKRRYALLQLVFYSKKDTEIFEKKEWKQKKKHWEETYLYNAFFQHFGNVWGRMFCAYLSSLRPHRVEYFNKKTGLIILSFPRDLQKFVLSSIPLVRKLGNYLECSCRTLALSGTVVKIKKKAVEHHLKAMREVLGTDPLSKEESIAEILNLEIQSFEEGR